jgi:hypothetical protein
MKIDNRHVMKPEHSVEVLNRLLALLDCSLARYLSFARPWVRRRYLLLDAVARRMSYEHEIFARRIARLISDRRGMVQSCVFPMGFTSYNDLSLEFLAPQLLEHQRALVVTAEESAKQLDEDPEVRRVVNKIVASLQRYAELLQELLSPNRVAPRPANEASIDEAPRRPASSLGRKRFEQYAAETHTAA